MSYDIRGKTILITGANRGIDTRERVSIETGDGAEQVTGPISLCRCGQSARKPFCDGTHNKTGFEAPAAEFDCP